MFGNPSKVIGLLDYANIYSFETYKYKRPNTLITEDRFIDHVVIIQRINIDLTANLPNMSYLEAKFFKIDVLIRCIKYVSEHVGQIRSPAVKTILINRIEYDLIDDSELGPR